MSVEDVIESHPLRLLDDETKIPDGELSLLLARSGVGKSAVLINFALDRILQGERVLHFSAGMTSEKTHQYYQEILADHTRHYPQTNELSWETVNRRFMVISYLRTDQMIADLDSESETLISSAHISPGMVVVDGLDFDHHAENNLKLLQSFATKHGTKLLASMLIHRKPNGAIDVDGPLDCSRSYSNHIYLMEPDKDRIRMEFLASSGSRELPFYFCPHNFIFRT